MAFTADIIDIEEHEAPVKCGGCNTLATRELVLVEERKHNNRSVFFMCGPCLDNVVSKLVSANFSYQTKG